MSISIVTVALNAADDLPLTIESVRQQNYHPIEHVLLDGGSRDRTVDVLDRYADAIDTIVHIEDAGIYSAMNIAVKHCTHDYVLFLNAKDTLFAANTLTRMMACKRHDTDVLFGNHVYVRDGKEYFKRSIDYDITAKILYQGSIDHLWLAQLPGHQATLVRRSLLQELRFNTDIAIAADHDLMIRAFHAGARFQYIDECVSHYVGGGFSSQHPERLRLEWCAIYRQYSINPASVDRFFLGDAPSPFGPQNQLTGITLSGDYPREGPYHERGITKPISWCRADGTQLRAPTRGRASALLIEGYCPFDAQSLLFLCGNEEVAELSLGEGWFKRILPLTHGLEPGAVLEIVASKAGDVSSVDTRVVGFAIASYAFEFADDLTVALRRGDRLDFSADNQAATASTLGEGWGPQEDRFIWSVGDQAGLRVRLAANVKTVVLQCSGNPFIDDPTMRGVDVALDDQFLARHLLTTETSEITLHCPERWAGGVANIALRPLLRLSPPNDPRTLGVCLVSLECR